MTMKETYYVYKFSKNGVPLYIGRTNNLVRRHDQHGGTDFFRESDKFEYMEFENSIDHVIAEMYLINKFKPKYNVVSNFDKTSTELEINLPNFIDATGSNLNGNENINKVNHIKKIERQKRKDEMISDEKSHFLNNGFELNQYKKYGREYFKGYICVSVSQRAKPPYEVVVSAIDETYHTDPYYERFETAGETYQWLISNVPQKYFEGNFWVDFEDKLHNSPLDELKKMQ